MRRPGPRTPYLGTHTRRASTRTMSRSAGSGNRIFTQVTSAPRSDKTICWGRFEHINESARYLIFSLVTTGPSILGFGKELRGGSPDGGREVHTTGGGTYWPAGGSLFLCRKAWQNYFKFFHEVDKYIVGLTKPFFTILLSYLSFLNRDSLLNILGE